MKRVLLSTIVALLLLLTIMPVFAEEPVTLTFWTDPRFRNIEGLKDQTSLPGQ